VPKLTAYCNSIILLTMNNLNSRVGIFVAGAVVGGLLTSLWFMATPMGLATKSEKSATSTTVGGAVLPPDLSGSVSVASQKAGESVFIESVTVPPPGVWVAVREVRGAELGNILGAGRARGPVSQFEIPLLRGTVAGQTYAVQLFRDDGDDVFSKDLDSVYIDFDTGEPVVQPFQTTP